jgi:hypothetical protein
MVFCLLLLLIVSVVHGFQRPPTTAWIVRHRVLPDAGVADAVVYGPVFQPAQAVVTVGILTTFLAVQTRINRSNNLLQQLEATNNALKKARNEMISGDADARARVTELESTAARLAAEWTDTATVVRLPNYTLRFRTARPDLIPNEEVSATPSSPSVSDDDNDTSSSSERGLTGLRFTALADMTPLQKVLVVVGVGVVATQVWLLTLLAVDPMAASSAGSGGNPFAEYSSF